MMNETPKGATDTSFLGPGTRLQKGLGVVLGLVVLAYWITGDLINDWLVYGDEAYYADDFARAEEHYSRVILVSSWRPALNKSPSLRAHSELAIIYLLTERYEEAETLLEGVVEKRRQLQEVDDPQLARDIQNLWAAYSYLGKNGFGLPLAREILEFKRATLGDEHLSTMEAMSNLAVSLSDLNRHAEAVDLWEDVLRIARLLLEEEDPNLRLTMTGLIRSYKALGRWGEVIPLEVEVVTLLKREFGPDHPKAIDAVSLLSTTYNEAGDLETALALSLEVLDTARRTMTPEDPSYRIALGNAAKSFNRLSRAAEALPLALEALALAQASEGSDTKNTLAAMFTAAQTYRLVGAYDEALSTSRTAVAIAQDTLGVDDELTIRLLTDLPTHLSDAGHFAEAVAVNEANLFERRRTLGPEHHTVWFVMNNLGANYSGAGRYSDALETLRNALELIRRIRGQAHPNVLTSVRNLAAMYRMIGRNAEALALMQDAVEMSEALYGADDFRTINVRLELANTYYLAGDLNAAMPLTEAALSERRTRLGPTHPYTLSAMSNLSDILQGMGRNAEALELRRDAYEISKTERGAMHVKTASYATSASISHFYLGDYEAARAMAEEARDILSAVLGPVHLLTAKANLWLAKSNLLIEHPFAALGPARAALEGVLSTMRAASDEVGDGPNAFSGKAADEAAHVLAVVSWQAANVAGLSDEDPDLVGAPQNAPAALRAEAFEAMQMNEVGAASALARAAGRIAAGNVGLGPVVTAWELALAEQAALEASRTQLLESPPEDAKTAALQADEISRMRIEVSRRVRQSKATLLEQYPRFFDLVAPEPLSIAELQGSDALLGDDEVLLTLVPPRFGLSGFVWAVSRDAVAWAPIALSETALRGRLSQLHAALDDTGEMRGTFDLEGTAPTAWGQPFDRALAYGIYNGFFDAPQIRAVTEGKDNWILAPQGMLLSLPFSALITTPPSGGAAADADPAALRQTSWLGIERALSVVPSVSSIRTLRSAPAPAQPASSGAFFGIGDPDFSGIAATQPAEVLASADNYFRGAVANPQSVRQLAPLPGTRREIETLAALFRDGQQRVDVLLGAEASERQLFAANDSGALREADVIVFATHGLMAGAFDGMTEPALALTPPRCGPVPIDAIEGYAPPEAGQCGPDIPLAALNTAALSGARIDDGLLTASEAARLRLNAGWVVLSACDTAAGADQSPDAEGLSGLARAFFYAGAQSLLVSHWPVRDEIAARLTPDAIEKAKGRLSRAEAFRQAMQSILNDTSLDGTAQSLAHPSVWSAFQVTGVDQIRQ